MRFWCNVIVVRKTHGMIMKWPDEMYKFVIDAQCRSLIKVFVNI